MFCVPIGTTPLRTCAVQQRFLGTLTLNLVEPYHTGSRTVEIPHRQPSSPTSRTHLNIKCRHPGLIRLPTQLPSFWASPRFLKKLGQWIYKSTSFSGHTNDNNYVIMSLPPPIWFRFRFVFARVYFCQQVISGSCFYHVYTGRANKK